jgi:hypothetical protein
MTYTNKNIKESKGQLILLTYKTRNKLQNKITGTITASTKEKIIFSVNNGSEIVLGYDRLVNIEKPVKEETNSLKQ